MTDQQDAGRAEGERRKDDALATLAGRREVYIRRGRRVLLEELLRRGGIASIDNVRLAVELASGLDPRCFGAVPGPLARAGIIRRDGFVASFRPERHHSFISAWRLADREAAERWLRDHPDLPDPTAEDRGAAGGQKLLFPLTANEPSPAAATVELGMEAQ